MGRLFARGETNKDSIAPTTTKGRLFKDIPAPAPKKTLGQKILNTGTAVSTFVGGKAVAEKIGAKIAKSGATEQEKQYITEPTNKQVAASVGEIGLNIAGLLTGGATALASKASKVAKLAALTAEGTAYGVGQAGLRGIQDQKSKEQINKDMLVGGAIGGGAALTLGVGGVLLSNAARKAAAKKAAQEAAENVPEIIPVPGSKLTPQERFAQYSERQGYEPYTPDAQLPSIEVGKLENGPIPSVEVGVPKTKKANGDFTYEPIKEPVKESVPVSSGTFKKSPISSSVSQIPEYTESVKTRAKKLSEDPEFSSSSNEEVVLEFDKQKKLLPKEKLIDYAVGRDATVIGKLPKTAALNLLREEAILNPSAFTPRELQRLTSNYAKSEAGKLLQATQVSKNGIINNPFDMAAVYNRELQLVAEKSGTTNKTISRFLDDIECK